MKTWIKHIYRNSKLGCDFCGSLIVGYQIGVDGSDDIIHSESANNLFSKRLLECCEECAELILGEDISTRIENYSKYIERFDEYQALLWQQTANPLIVAKYYKQWNVRIMRDKYGQKKYGVLLGVAERWNWREKPQGYYVDPHSYLLTSFEMAERIAFYWVDFVDYFGVKPEDTHSVEHFKALSRSLARGELPQSIQDAYYA